MTFTHQLYEQLSQALPDMTTRRFSRYCGKSEGYYGSITSQSVPISTNSLIHLAQCIEQVIVQRVTPESATARQLRRIQQMIADEIALRTHDLSIANLSVRRMIIGAVAKAAYRHDHHYNLPAVILG